MKKYKLILLVGFLIAVAGVLMLFIGIDYGQTQAKNYIIQNQMIHEDTKYYYVDIDGERYSYFK